VGKKGKKRANNRSTRHEWIEREEPYSCIRNPASAAHHRHGRSSRSSRREMETRKRRGKLRKTKKSNSGSDSPAPHIIQTNQIRSRGYLRRHMQNQRWRCPPNHACDR
jgi:hypothetical protein